jgi:hypothetical protein
MITLVQTKHFWLKFIFVRGRTSLQSHERRTEYHLSLRGIIKIMPQERHRMERGMYIEVATGEPLEEDIKRFEDDYGRV